MAIYEREFYTHDKERWVLRLDRHGLGLTVVKYEDHRQQGGGIAFEEFYAVGRGPEHKAFVQLVESLVPETEEYELS